MGGMEGTVARDEKAKKEHFHHLTTHTLKSPINNPPARGNTIISDATISYDARTGAEYAQHTTLTHTTHATTHNPTITDPINCPPPSMIPNGKVPSRLMRPRGRGGQRTRRKEGENFQCPSSPACPPLLSVAPSRKVACDSAPDCNIGPPRDGETPRADKATSPRPHPTAFSRSTPCTKPAFLPSLSCFFLCCPRSRGHSGCGLFPLSSLCVCRFGPQCKQASMQGHLFCRAFFLPHSTTRNHPLGPARWYHAQACQAGSHRELRRGKRTTR